MNENEEKVEELSHDGLTNQDIAFMNRRFVLVRHLGYTAEQADQIIENGTVFEAAEKATKNSLFDRAMKTLFD